MLEMILTALLLLQLALHYNVEGKHYLVKTKDETSLKENSPVHNVYIVQYVFLPTEQSETYFKNFILTYDLTYICPGLFDWKENTFFFIFVKSNSKSGRFSSFLMPNNFGTGQKKAYFLGALEN